MTDHTVRRRMGQLTLTLVLLTSLCSCWQSDGYKTYPIEFVAAGHRFMVPRNYFVSLPTRTNDPDYSIAADLQMLLPDLEPITPSNKDLFTTASERRLFVGIAKRPATTPMSIDKIAGGMRFSESVAHTYTQMGMTNVLYAGTSGARKTGTDYFTTKDKAFVMACTGVLSSWAKAPGCSSRLIIRKNIDVYIRFARSRFNEFPAIVRRLEEFVAAHEIQQQEKPQ